MTRRILATGLVSAALFSAVLGATAPAEEPAASPTPAVTATATAGAASVLAASATATATATATASATAAATATATATASATATATPATTSTPTPFPSPVQTTIGTPTATPGTTAAPRSGGWGARRLRAGARPNTASKTGSLLSCPAGMKLRDETSTSTRGCVKTGDAKKAADEKAAARQQHDATAALPEPKLTNADGTPAPTNPSYVLAAPGPARIGVPNFFIDKFRIPPFLLPIYQAAGMEYGIRWEVLAAINEIETDYGRNLNVSSAGARGWMQFMPATWRQWGVDANRDGVEDPYNPVDAIFAAARYLRAAGGASDLRRAIFAYNHADWYVDSVLMRAQVIGGLPSDLVGSLTGLTQGRFPVRARATYAGAFKRGARRGRDAAVVVEGDATRRGIDIFARAGAPAVAVNDAKVLAIGHSPRRGRFVRIQDVYGNVYTYSQLASVPRTYPAPRPHRGRRHLAATTEAPASAPAKTVAETPSTPAVASAGKLRLFAHPARPVARTAGGAGQLKTPSGKPLGAAAAPIGFDARNFRPRPLRRGSRILAGTRLGRIGATVPGMAPHLHFAIRPAGRGAPRIDPKPILDGWKLLESTAIYRAKGRNPLMGTDDGGPTIGQVMLMGKAALGRRVLDDDRISIYSCGRADIRAGAVDRRVLATLEFLAISGMKPTVSSLRCGHGYLTSSGNVSEHSTGTAVDIAAINGIPIAGHQGPGSITDLAIQRLLTLQGTMKPHQIISLMTFRDADNTLALPDHWNHIHVGWRPLYGQTSAATKEIDAALKPDQWIKLIGRLGAIRNPHVSERPSKYAVADTRRARTGAAGD